MIAFCLGDLCPVDLHAAEKVPGTGHFHGTDGDVFVLRVSDRKTVAGPVIPMDGRGGLVGLGYADSESGAAFAGENILAERQGVSTVVGDCSPR